MPNRRLQVLRWFRLLWGLSSLFLTQTASTEVPGVKYFRSNACSVQYGYNFVKSVEARSAVMCVTKCRHEPLCDVVSFCRNSTGGHCVMSQRTDDLTFPVFAEESCSCFEKRCLHGGEEVAGEGCKCDRGYIGNRCDRLAADCQELKAVNASAKLDVFLVQPSAAPHPVSVHCSGQGHNIVMRRALGSEDFNRSWAEYLAGFGNLDDYSGEVMRGLPVWHYLTASKTYHLQVYVTDINKTDYRIVFHDFRVGDEASGFLMTFSGTSGVTIAEYAGDSLSASNGSRFSTYDKDQDQDPSKHCAQLHGGGWWFSDCGDSNPTGPLNRPADGLRLGIPAEAFWTYDLGNRAIWQIRFFMYTL